MNSFNHYAYGSVVEWFYDTIAGLRPDPATPGWKHFEIAPTPGGGLTHAQASIETPYGPVASDWQVKGGTLELAVTIPPNTSARLRLPSEVPADVLADGRPLAELREASGVRVEQGRVTLELLSGRYRFAIQPTALR
jgi:alpha-L-rhamnosidase